MKSALGILLVITLSLPFNYCVNAQTPSTQEQDEVVRVRSNEVKLDVVVKDKKGRPVKDLKDTDFEVYEDGALQRIQSFRFVAREESNASTDRKENRTEQTTQQTTASTEPGIIALVFDRLSPESRNLARKAGLAYVQEGMAGGDFTGVFGIDLSLRTYQSFTDNQDLVRQAVERATGASTSTYASGAAKVRDMADRSVALEQESATSQAAAAAAGAARDSAGASAAGQASGQAAAEQKFIELETSMREQFEILERDQQGYATINSLLAVIAPMQKLPGRKSLIFFSEGLAIPTSVHTKFQTVINAANKANVSIYAIDAAGLRVESGTAEAAREINSLAQRRMQQVGRGNDSGTSGPYMRALEKNEDVLRMNPQGGLGVLADETGGFLIHDTNDLTSGVRRINDDMRGYYMITYVPQNTDYNGHFRQVNVKLSHGNYEVQARKGYYAVESVGQLPMLDYEIPAIAAARNAQPSSNPFPFRAGALSYPAINQTGLSLILAEAPLSAFTFARSSDKKSYNTDFSIIGLIKNQANQVIQKVSHHYLLTGPIDKLDSAQKEDLLFYRETQLPPGSYTVELIAYDASTGKASVSMKPLEVPGADESRPRMSSISVLKRGERLTAEEQKRDQPFHFGELLVYPNLGEAIQKSTAKQLAFFFTAWPAKGSQAPLQLTLEILQNKRRLGQTSGQLPAADQQGQIKYASAFPLDKFQPGVYELKITVSDGKTSVSRSTDFTVAP